MTYAYFLKLQLIIGVVGMATSEVLTAFILILLALWHLMLAVIKSQHDASKEKMNQRRTTY